MKTQQQIKNDSEYFKEMLYQLQQMKKESQEDYLYKETQHLRLTKRNSYE